MFRFSTLVAGLTAAALASAGIAGAAPDTSHSAAHAVALSDARLAPTVIREVLPGHALTISRRRAADVEVSAYQWNGRALSAQRWNHATRAYYWRDAHGRAVTYSLRSGTFRNHTHEPVLVAAWLWIN